LTWREVVLRALVGTLCWRLCDGVGSGERCVVGGVFDQRKKGRWNLEATIFMSMWRGEAKMDERTRVILTAQKLALMTLLLLSRSVV